MEEEWVVVEEFPNYAVSTYGRIKNLDTNRIMRLQQNRGGTLMVGLRYDGYQYTRSVKMLVGKAFVRGYSDIFTSLINLDGDQHNIRADNLMWRPRWFVLAYVKQFDNLDRYLNSKPLIDNNGNLYDNVVEAAIRNGLLLKDIILNAGMGRRIFPEGKTFEYV